jgi:hypothetical protein
MTGKDVFLLLLGIVLFISGLVAVIGLVAETSEHQIPREHICMASQHHQKNFDRLWDSIIRKTGIDESTAALTRISLEINPDDSVEKMDLQFTAKKNGVEGYYAVWYRQDSPECGWVDGLTYPGVFPDFEPVNIMSPRNIFSEIREIPLSAMDLSGKKVRILGDCTQKLQALDPDTSPAVTDYFWTQRTLVPAQPGSRTVAHFCLDYSQMNCTVLREGLTSCRNERLVRVFSSDSPGTCRCIGQNNR